MFPQQGPLPTTQCRNSTKGDQELGVGYGGHGKNEGRTSKALRVIPFPPRGFWRERGDDRRLGGGQREVEEGGWRWEEGGCL